MSLIQTVHTISRESWVMQWGHAVGEKSGHHRDLKGSGRTLGARSSLPLKCMDASLALAPNR